MLVDLCRYILFKIALCAAVSFGVLRTVFYYIKLGQKQSMPSNELIDLVKNISSF